MTKNLHKYIETRKAIARANQMISAIIKGDASEETQEQMLAWFRNGENSEIKLDAFEQALFRCLSPNEQPNEEDRRKYEELLERLGLAGLEPSQYLLKVKPKRTFTQIALRIAAIMIPVALIVGAYLWYDQTTMEVPAVAVHYVSSPGDEHRHIVLADGTEVTLNKESELTYTAERECTLTGEAYFKVQRGEKPFIVRTGYIDITVLGTEFNVNAYPDGDVSAVALYSGSVKLDYERGSYRLEPGWEFRYDPVSKEVNMQQVDLAGEAKPAWLLEQGIFQTHSLGWIFDSIESAYGVTIANKHIIDTTHVYSFRFDGSEQLDVLLSSLRDASGQFDYTIDGGAVILETVKK